MAAKKSVTSTKVANKQANKANKAKVNKNKTQKSTTKQKKPETPKPKVELSKTKLKKKEFQKKKYNKEKKEEEEDSDFEIVPSTQEPLQDFSDSEDDEGNDSDLQTDMFSSFKAKPKALPSSATASTKPAAPITMSDSEDDSDQEERFIANENMAANRKNKKSGGFQSMGLSQPVFKAILHKGFKVPTPIQRKCIPIVLEGQDVVGMARTGSGKTAAFLIPMLEKLKTHSAKVGARALVLSPSRELALQTQKVCKELGKYTDIRSCVLVGGDNLNDQFSMIASNPDILIATPGRLLHLSVEMDLDLRTVEYVVFDEADRLFEMGFAVQLHEILSRLPPTRQSLLFSATLPKMLVDFAKAGLQEPTLVRLDVDTKISRDLEMAFFSIKEVEREAALLYLLRHVIKLPKTTSNKDDYSKDKKSKKKQAATEADHQTIIFAATKHHVEYLANILILAGYQVSYVYGSLDQTARNIQINRFRTGRTNLLVVTDVAARGIDIPILENVINYDLCGSSKVFVHRVGRAARAGRRGWAYSLVTAEELPYVVDLELFLTRPLVVGSNEKEELDYTSDLVVGTMPKDALIDDVSWVHQKVEEDASLDGLHKTAMNAYKLYNRTKPRAAPESYTRAKAVVKKPTWTDLHPLLISEENSNTAELERLDFISKISGFRPSETIFEIGQRGVKGANAATMIMRQRRQTVGGVISAVRSQAAIAAENAPKRLNKSENNTDVPDLGGDVEEEELAKAFNIPAPKESSKNKKNSYRDEEFYLSYTQKDANTERGYSMTNTGNFMEQAAKAQLDLIGDDKDTMQQKKNQLRWDSKKKKFVQGMGIGADNKKMIRTESGALISASFKSGRFDEWSKKTHISLPRTGEQELSSAQGRQQKRFRHKRQDSGKPLDPLSYDYEKKLKKRSADQANLDTSVGVNQKKQKATGQKRVGGRNAKSELKNASQIRKTRVQKEKRKEKTARGSKKGKGRR
ncbi:ATP-dependent RNA helicase dbp10 [Apophysomyces sp. BC1034]|nr:ATP-dependent RNA helicase dbp10 [Apophysomyces sp. BC1015]KAG0183598.1 ATP-dependent RNA helicase dbp10 [Apophysomyces sp. BC1021]KAG0183622.1 ATP-dependent RNA helicase dbp10 [Apophysomyces sp. BC1021]KAG0194880.1 ATP-dependent RNA helicase dbp10 [Apophysomyces sp. BC1034]